MVPKKKRNDAAADTIYKATEDINEEAIEVPQPEQLPHLLIPTLLWDKIVTGADWNIVNYCLGSLGTVVTTYCLRNVKNLLKNELKHPDYL